MIIILNINHPFGTQSTSTLFNIHTNALSWWLDHCEIINSRRSNTFSLKSQQSVIYYSDWLFYNESKLPDIILFGWTGRLFINCFLWHLWFRHICVSWSCLIAQSIAYILHKSMFFLQCGCADALYVWLNDRNLCLCIDIDVVCVQHWKACVKDVKINFCYFSYKYYSGMVSLQCGLACDLRMSLMMECLFLQYLYMQVCLQCESVHDT